MTVTNHQASAKSELLKSIERFEHSIRAGRSEEWLFDCAFAQATALGAESIAYAHSPPLGASDFTRPRIITQRGLPASWPSTYFKRRYFEHDPIYRTAFSQVLPFYWHEVHNLKTISKSEQAYLNHLKNEGIDYGICIPVFGPRGRNGYFGIGYGESRQELPREHVLHLQNMCQLTHQYYCRLVKKESARSTCLSKREVEVLRLILSGSSGNEIASKLQISEHSVATYLRRANDKLGTNSRFEAATKAQVIGLLD